MMIGAALGVFFCLKKSSQHAEQLFQVFENQFQFAIEYFGCRAYRRIEYTSSDSVCGF